MSAVRYQKITIGFSAEAAEPLTAALFHRGVTEIAVTDPSDIRELLAAGPGKAWDFIDDSLTELSLGEGRVIEIYVEDSPAKLAGMMKDVYCAVAEVEDGFRDGHYGKGLPLQEISISVDEVEVDWEKSYRESFHAVAPAPGLYVRPPWEEAPADVQADIVIDPGSAFGTGSHETTYLCLEALSETVAPDVSVLDIGAGSGILSIAAVKLSADLVVGVEADCDAVGSAEENIRRNGVSGKVTLVCGDITEASTEAEILDIAPQGGFGIVVANISRTLIKLVFPGMAGFLKTDGILILSGLLAEEAEEMDIFLSRMGFETLKAKTKGDWLALQSCRVYARDSL
ncbi:MAG: 50S ribosomal protein L11 methyltransferase [Clostridiales Family XIII bacterium]|jgi:ribosomal protein L11 methyltransferase|nr:50S ribosomal protein L11 methyltransferase [Clostridiales Family XIII bacterium]